MTPVAGIIWRRLRRAYFLGRATLFALLGVVSALGATTSADAHSVALAILKITEIAEGRYTINWEMKPSLVGRPLHPIFPDHCAVDGSLLDCGDRGLIGQLSFEGLGASSSAAMFKIRTLNGDTSVFTLTPVKPTARVSPSFSAETWAGKSQIATAYLNIGVEHILLGVDHLLFVLGLIWVARGRWMLLRTITAFTVAHSITLAAVTFGWVGVHEPFVNALIALSIVFIGVEALKAREGETTLTLRYPWVVSFGFGLLHGFGFANALVELGLPERAIPLALLAFNVGVEVGQILFVFGVLSLAWAYRVMRVSWPGWAQVAPAYAIGGLAMLWFLTRVEALIAA